MTATVSDFVNAEEQIGNEDVSGANSHNKIRDSTSEG
jgi:hypothetical protein